MANPDPSSSPMAGNPESASESSMNSTPPAPESTADELANPLPKSDPAADRSSPMAATTGSHPASAAAARPSPPQPSTVDSLPPATVDELLRFGLAALSLRRLNDAEMFFRRGFTEHPTRADFALNLTNVLATQGRLEEAFEVCSALLRSQPEHADALYLQGRLHEDLGRTLEAALRYDAAIKAKPAHADAWNRLGILLRSRGKTEQALRCLNRAVALRPTSGEFLFDLAEGLRSAERFEDALTIYQEVQRIRPDHPMVRFAIAALSGKTVPSTAPSVYVKPLFDRYADHFDHHLVQVLGYKTPTLLRQLVEAFAKGRRFELLDLGCGTGLSGAAFQDVATRLVGVDLSPKMLEKARERGLYDQLEATDVLAFLQSHLAAFDLVLAADVFVYIGDLEPIFQAAARTLRPNGLFVFSVESHSGEDYVLKSTLRYAHSLDIIRRWAANHGFRELDHRTEALRTHNQEPIHGELFVLARG